MAIEGMIPAILWTVIIPLMVWEAVWKTVGMWKSARNSQLVWFICIAIFNTVGILPIVYIVFFQKKDAVAKKGKR
jgi:hypothetical protein